MNNTLKTPDVTPIQMIVGAITVWLTSIITLVNVFGWAEIDATEGAALMGVWSALGGIAVLADAIIRNGRSRALAAKPPAQSVDKIAG